MTTGVIATIPKFQFSSTTGVPLALGTLTVYLAGTTTPTDTWTDSALSAANTNPVVLDSGGSCTLWLDSTKSYKFLLKNAAGATQWTADNVSGADALLRRDLAASGGSALVGYMPAGTGAVATTVQTVLRENVSVTRFGAATNGTTNDYAAIAAAITYAATNGDTVYFPAVTSGLYGTLSQITLPNRVALEGGNVRAAGIVARAGFSDAWVLNAVNGTSALFDTRISKMTISGGDIAGVGCILSDAWQENSGASQCLIEKFRTYGIKFQNGYGGASSCVIDSCEIFGSSVAAATAGIRVEQISVIGSFKLTVSNSTVAGSASYPLPRGIDFVNDSSVMTNVHFEDCTSGVYLDGVGHHTLTCCDGSSTGVTNLVEIASTFTGSLTMINCKRNGATNFLKDNRVGGLGTITSQDYEMLVISGPLTEPNGLAAPNTAKAFATFDGTGAGPYLPGTAAMTAYFNITSIAKTGTGRWRVTIGNDIRLGTAAVPIAMSNLADATYTTALVTASTFDIGINVATVATDSSEVKFIVFCN